MQIGVAMALGLLGSLHCAAMCGPLLLVLPSPPGGAGRYIAGRLIYQLGRIATYCLLGVVAGLAGRAVFLAGWQGWLCIGLGMVVLSGLFLSRRVAVSPLLVGLVGRLKMAMSGQLRKRGFRSLLVLGLLNGLLPCGLVYVALAGAAAQGSITGGIIYMAFFGLGTVPMMLGIGFFARAFPVGYRQKLYRATPVAIGLVAVLLILRGLMLGIPYVSPGLVAGLPACCSR